MWPENELYGRWIRANQDERVQLETKLYYAFKRHAGTVVASILPEGHPDLSHDIAVAALQALPKFKGRSKPSTWVHTIALFHCYGVIRAKVRRRGVIDDSKEFNEEDYPQSPRNPIAGIALAEIAARVTRRDDLILLKCVLEGLDLSEIGNKLGISPNGADLRRRRLRTKIKNLCRT